MAKDTSWNEVANWYDKLLGGEDTFQSRVILPNLMRLLAPQPKEKVLDLACGQGFFSAVLAERDCAVTGVDLAAELIAAAKKRVPKAKFVCGTAADLSFLKDASQDVALCVLALQNIREARQAIAETSRVLKPGGRFAIVLNHPCFRIPRATSWGWDRDERQYRRVDAYLSESHANIEMHPGQDASITTVSYHRPLQFWIKSLGREGFGVVAMEEWVSHRVSDSGPRAEEENRARNEFPMFMCLIAKKL